MLTLHKIKALFLLFLLLYLVACQETRNKEHGHRLHITNEITIDEIHQSYQSGAYTVTDLTQFYLDRIDSLSNNGPRLNAVITINPDALDIAAQLDDEWKGGRIRGPLHGIPVLLKDNIDTHDKMPCTAGARVMENSFPLVDSPIAAQLRAAGAVILGKANLSEWANFHSNYSSSGWSALGGQTKNPYDLTRNPCGSSSGSGVAVAANLCVIAIGTETDGSIVCPSNSNGIVGIKPTVGLISRSGLIPISFNQDTGGPMARTVRDAAICLGTMTALDSMDAKMLDPERNAFADYTRFLKTDGLAGKRIGFYRSNMDDRFRVVKKMEEAVGFFKEQGAIVIEIEEFLDPVVFDHSFNVLLYEFKDGLNNYFKKLGTTGVVANLEDLIDKTFGDSVEMQYFDHMLLKMAQEKGDLTEKDYLNSLEKMWKLAREEGIDKVMDEHHLDAIISPTGDPAWKTDLINGDNFHVFSSSPAAIAGYPNITVPMGNIDGLPIGLSIFGRPWTEPLLLEIAYAYEQGTHHRISPEFKNGIE